MHTLRHTHASMLLYRGVPDETIRARLGHSEVTTTLSLYAHLLEGADRAAANAWEGVAGDVVGVPRVCQRERPDRGEIASSSRVGAAGLQGTPNSLQVVGWDQSER